MSTTFRLSSVRVIGALVACALLLGTFSIASAATTVTNTNVAVVGNLTGAAANSGLNAASGGSCGLFCSGGNGVVITGKAKAKTKTTNIVNTNIIIIQ